MEHNAGLEQRSVAPFYIALGFFLCAQISIALYARSRKENKSNAVVVDVEASRDEYNQHFAGGKSFGTLQTFLTYFSTAYSGYTVSGIPDEASRVGFIALWWMMAYNVMNAFNLIWKPRLRRLSVARNWVAFQDPITDRFDNRLLSGLVVVFGVGGQFIYIMVQMYSMRSLIETITAGRDGVDSFALTWVLAFVMLFAEVSGGFRAVVFTDSIQSCVMLSGMILMPIVATYHFGGVTSSVASNCVNLEVLNCTEGTFLFERGAACKGSITTNGCLAHKSVAPWLALHPSVGMSEYFKPIWTTVDGNLWPEYPCKDELGNLTGGLCPNPLSGSEVIPATRGFDGAWIFNMTSLFMGQLAYGFFTVGFMPNFVTRVYTAKTDLTVKKASILQVLIGGPIAVLPAILVGVMAGANLKKQYPPGSGAFGMLVSNFIDRGGFNEVVGVLASLGAIAAFMSTADSSAISSTTMIMIEFFQNGLFRAYPRFNTRLFAQVASACFSACWILGATAVALYDPVINDPESFAYQVLMQWQGALLGFLVCPILCAIFLPKASDWAVLAGLFAAVITFAALGLTGRGTYVGTLSYTPFADDPKHIGLLALYWALIANISVSVPLCFVDIGKRLPTPDILRCNTKAYHPEGTPLSYTDIVKAMEGTSEVIKDPKGIACIAIVFVLVFFSIPQFGKSYDGCTLLSYPAWFDGDGSPVDSCEGPSLCGGIPCWTWPCLIFFALNKLIISFGWTLWKTIDEEGHGSPLGSSNEERKTAWADNK